MSAPRRIQVRGYARATGAVRAHSKTIPPTAADRVRGPAPGAQPTPEKTPGFFARAVARVKAWESPGARERRLRAEAQAEADRRTLARVDARRKREARAEAAWFAGHAEAIAERMLPTGDQREDWRGQRIAAFTYWDDFARSSTSDRDRERALAARNTAERELRHFDRVTYPATELVRDPKTGKIVPRALSEQERHKRADAAFRRPTSSGR